MDEQLQAVIRALREIVFPVGEELSATRFRRTWIVRTAATLPHQHELDSTAKAIVGELEVTLREHYAGSVREDDLAANVAHVQLVRITDVHCAIVVDLPRRGVAIGDAIEVGTYGAVRAFARKLPVEDVQGLPKELWFEL